MNECNVCAEGLHEVGYQCIYCGEVHCRRHRRPDPHDCAVASKLDDT